MDYLFQNRLFRPVHSDGMDRPRVMVADNEEYALALYTYHLARQKFQVLPCRETGEIHRSLFGFSPNLLVVNPQIWGSGPRAFLQLRRCRELLPSLLIVTVGLSTGHEEIRAFMDLGASAHIDRRLSRPQDLAEIVCSLL